jgi:hypothetical protein
MQISEEAYGVHGEVHLCLSENWGLLRISLAKNWGFRNNYRYQSLVKSVPAA